MPLSFVPIRACLTVVERETSSSEDHVAHGLFEKDAPRFSVVAIQLIAIAIHYPVFFVIANWRATASLASIGFVAAAVSLVAIALFFGLQTKWAGWRSLEVATAATMSFWYWKSLQVGQSTLGSVLVSLSLATLVVAAAYKLADHRYFRVGVFASSVTLVSVGLLVLIQLVLATPAHNIDVDAHFNLDQVPTTLPDIYMLVVDAYARSDVLLEDYGYSNAEFLQRLEDEGFEIADSAVANYSATHFSVASSLSGSYVTEPGADITTSDLRALSRVMGGDNATVKTLKSLGYTYVHGPSNWWGSACGAAVDHCLDTPFVDITVFDLLSQTPFGPLLYPVAGDPGTKVALDRIQEFESWAAEAPPWASGATFVFLHVLIPHPPLFLNAECEPVPTPDLSTRRMNSYPAFPGQLLETRMTAFVEQTKCANSLIETFIDAVPDEALVIVMSDHGPDSRSQLALPPTLWDEAAVKERFANLIAVRAPCVGKPELDNAAVNTMRHVLRCGLGADLPDIEHRFFVVPSARHVGPLTELAPTWDLFSPTSRILHSYTD